MLFWVIFLLPFSEHGRTNVSWFYSICSIIVSSSQIIKKKWDLQEVGGGRGDWIKLAQDRDRWRVLVGTGRDFRVP
jgi:hypothetical protein